MPDVSITDLIAAERSAAGRVGYFSGTRDAKKYEKAKARVDAALTPVPDTTETEALAARKVEVTDEMVEKAAKRIWEVRFAVSDDEWWERTDQGPYKHEARAALGGGES